MNAETRPTAGSPTTTRRALRIALALLGVAGLLMKRRYAGPLQGLVLSYGGNVAASFAVYFILAASSLGVRFGPWWAAGAALLAVEAFEITDGFGVMSNTYDFVDLLANAGGVAAAWAVDRLLTSMRSRSGA